MAQTIFVINPGSTSTKVAIYQAADEWNLTEIRHAEVKHDPDEMVRHPEPVDQLELRTQEIESFLAESGDIELHAVAGRGGLTHPLEAGSYRINEAMKYDLRHSRYGAHASNLGALIAAEIARKRGITSLIADPVGVDQFEPLARYSGWPEIDRKCQLHALNMRAVARQCAKDMGGVMENFRFIIAHLGGGISISPMKDGRLIDVNHAMDGGPFSPQRVGAMPVRGLIDLCYSGEYATAKELKAVLTRKGGLMAYLGTDDGREVIRQISEGNEKAREVYEAMAYQIAKEIGAMATVLHGKVDAVILTGGLPHPPLSDWIVERCGWIAPVKIYAGEQELLALAQAAARHLIGAEKLREYTR